MLLWGGDFMADEKTKKTISWSREIFNALPLTLLFRLNLLALLSGHSNHENRNKANQAGQWSLARFLGNILFLPFLPIWMWVRLSIQPKPFKTYGALCETDTHRSHWVSCMNYLFHRLNKLCYWERDFIFSALCALIALPVVIIAYAFSWLWVPFVSEQFLEKYQEKTTERLASSLPKASSIGLDTVVINQEDKETTIALLQQFKTQFCWEVNGKLKSFDSVVNAFESQHIEGDLDDATRQVVRNVLLASYKGLLKTKVTAFMSEGALSQDGKLKAFSAVVDEFKDKQIKGDLDQDSQQMLGKGYLESLRAHYRFFVLQSWRNEKGQLKTVLALSQDFCDQYVHGKLDKYHQDLLINTISQRLDEEEKLVESKIQEELKHNAMLSLGKLIEKYPTVPKAKLDELYLRHANSYLLPPEEVANAILSHIQFLSDEDQDSIVFLPFYGIAQDDNRDIVLKALEASIRPGYLYVIPRRASSHWTSMVLDLREGSEVQGLYFADSYSGELSRDEYKFWNDFFEKNMPSSKPGSLFRRKNIMKLGVQNDDLRCGDWTVWSTQVMLSMLLKDQKPDERSVASAIKEVNLNCFSADDPLVQRRGRANISGKHKQFMHQHMFPYHRELYGRVHEAADQRVNIKHIRKRIETIARRLMSDNKKSVALAVQEIEALQAVGIDFISSVGTEVMAQYFSELASEDFNPLFLKNFDMGKQSDIDRVKDFITKWRSIRKGHGPKYLEDCCQEALNFKDVILDAKDHDNQMSFLEYFLSEQDMHDQSLTFVQLFQLARFAALTQTEKYAKFVECYDVVVSGEEDKVGALDIEAGSIEHEFLVRLHHYKDGGSLWKAVAGDGKHFCALRGQLNSEREELKNLLDFFEKINMLRHLFPASKQRLVPKDTILGQYDQDFFQGLISKAADKGAWFKHYDQMYVGLLQAIAREAGFDGDNDHGLDRLAVEHPVPLSQSAFNRDGSIKSTDSKDSKDSGFCESNDDEPDREHAKDDAVQIESQVLANTVGAFSTSGANKPSAEHLVTKPGPS